MKKLLPVIGLEVHIELATKTKMFCSCPSDHFGKVPNSQVCPVCLGLPGALPYPNYEAIVSVIKFGLAFESKINLFSKFDRKHYFYPDLPKSYQISQYDLPFCTGGIFRDKKIRRVHLEEDTGKLVHQKIDGDKVSLIDFNRSGVALMEMVTEPDFHDIGEVVDFLKEVQLVARYLDISGADMEKGSMRLEANVSLSGDGSIPTYKVELKNINSFRFLEKAVNAELKRQEKVLSDGGTVDNETRGYDEVKQTTFSQRSKEQANDYRYFPEPDLPPIVFSSDQVQNIKDSIPELPEPKRKRFEKEYGLSGDYAEFICDSMTRAQYYEEAVKIGLGSSVSPKLIADLIKNKRFDETFPEPAGLIKKIVELTSVEYSGTAEVENAVAEAINENQKAVADYKAGKGAAIGFLIGIVQKKLNGKGNPKLVQEAITKLVQK